MNMKEKETKAIEKSQTKFYFPKENKSVEAGNMKEAEKKLKKYK